MGVNLDHERLEVYQRSLILAEKRLAQSLEGR
jgi:hypothetical protein